MLRRRSAQQGDLFEIDDHAVRCEPPPADFIARIRDELARTLTKAREASALPWRDITQAYLAELRFNSIIAWLPPDEARVLRADFQRELGRLYAAYAGGEGT
jgi:hypothetical protein